MADAPPSSPRQSITRSFWSAMGIGVFLGVVVAGGGVFASMGALLEMRAALVGLFLCGPVIALILWGVMVAVGRHGDRGLSETPVEGQVPPIDPATGLVQLEYATPRPVETTTAGSSVGMVVGGLLLALLFVGVAREYAEQFLEGPRRNELGFTSYANRRTIDQRLAIVIAGVGVTAFVGVWRPWQRRRRKFPFVATGFMLACLVLAALHLLLK